MKGGVPFPFSFPLKIKNKIKRVNEEAQGNEGPPSSRPLIISQESGADFSYFNRSLREIWEVRRLSFSTIQNQNLCIYGIGFEVVKYCLFFSSWSNPPPSTVPPRKDRRKDEVESLHKPIPNKNSEETVKAHISHGPSRSPSLFAITSQHGVRTHVPLANRRIQLGHWGIGIGT